MFRMRGVSRLRLTAALLALAGMAAAGCDGEQSKPEVAQLRLETASLQEQLRQTRDELEQAKRRGDELNNQRASFEDDLRRAGIAPGGLEKLWNRYPEPFRLFGEVEWKEVTIRGENGAGDAVRITDPEQLAALSGFLQIRGVVGDGIIPSGLHARGPIYTYTISGGNQTCTVTSYGEGFIQINDIPDVLWAYDRVSAPGEALVPRSGDQGANSVLARLEGSAGFRTEGSKAIWFLPFRVRMLASPLLFSGAKEEPQPGGLGRPARTYYFYNRGAEIRMELYDEYVSLKDAGETHWYRLGKDAVEQIRAAESAG